MKRRSKSSGRSGHASSIAFSVEELRDQLDMFDAQSTDYRRVYEEILSLAEAGAVDAADLIAELSAFDPALHNPEIAYKFYNIALEAQGYSVAFDNRSTDAGHYLGPPGDFRNEPQVSDLVQQLGLAACKRIDEEAEQWRSRLS